MKLTGTPIFFALGIASAVASFGACSGGSLSNSSSSADSSPLPCAVDAVLAQNCRQCHANPPQFSAPMPLVTHGDVVAPSHSDPSVPVYKQMDLRIHDDAHPMPQPPNARLSAVAMATLDDWIAAGAPAGTSSCGGGGDGGQTSDGGGNPDDSGVVIGADATTTPDGGVVIGPDASNTCPDLHLSPASAWSMPQSGSDIYTCYGFDVTTAEKRQVIKMAARIDNTKIVHHLLVFQSPNAMSGTPTECNLSNSVNWRMVYGWAPGGQPLDMPAEAGYPLDANTTTHYVVQIHYSNPNQLAGQTDTSGVDMCSTDQLRPNDADTIALGSTSFTIQPKSTLDLTCNFTIPKQLPGQLHAFAGFPHMHQIGKSISGSQLPGGNGAPVDLGAQANWDFNSQLWFPISANIQGGDVMRTRCVWNNPGDTAVSFGEYTKDEMCFDFVMYYPKVTVPGWSWLAPAAGASCAPTP